MLLTVFLGKIQCAGVFKICKTIYKNDEYLKCIVYCLYVEHVRL